MKEKYIKISLFFPNNRKLALSQTNILFISLTFTGKSDYKHATERRFKIGIIADLDKQNKVPGKKFEWRSQLKTGHLKIEKSGKCKVKFSDDVKELRTNLSHKGRGN